MPGGDGTGPWWSSGNWTCRGRRGMGFGMGAGRGMGRRFVTQAPSKENELKMLEDYLKGLEAELDEVKKRIAELKGK